MGSDRLSVFVSLPGVAVKTPGPESNALPLRHTGSNEGYRDLLYRGLIWRRITLIIPVVSTVRPAEV